MQSANIIPHSVAPVQHPEKTISRLSDPAAPHLTIHVGRCGILAKNLMRLTAQINGRSPEAKAKNARLSICSVTSEESIDDHVSIVEVHAFTNSLSRERFRHAQEPNHDLINDSDSKELPFSGSPSLSNKALAASIRNALRCRATPEEPMLSYQYGNLPADEARSLQKDEHATVLRSKESTDHDHLEDIPLSLMSPSAASEPNEQSQSSSGRNDGGIEEVITYEAEAADCQEHSLSKSDQFDLKMTAEPLSVKEGALATILDGDAGAEERSENNLASSELGSNETSVMQADRHVYNQNNKNNVFTHNNNGFNFSHEGRFSDPRSSSAKTGLEKASEKEESKRPEDDESSRPEIDRGAKPLNANPQDPTSHASMTAAMTPGQHDLTAARETTRPIVLPAKKLRKPWTVPASVASHASDVPVASANARAPLEMKHCGQVLGPEQGLKLAKALIKTGVRLLEESEKHFHLGSSIFGKQLHVSDSNVQKHIKIVQEDGPANGLHLQFKCFAEQFGAVDFHEADWTNGKVGTKHKAHAMKRCVHRIKQDLESALKKGDFKFERAANGEVTAITFNVTKTGYAHPLSYRIPLSLQSPKSFSFEMKDTKDLRGEPIRARVLNITPSPLNGNRDIPVNVELMDKLVLEHAMKWEGKIRGFNNQLGKSKLSLMRWADTKEGRMELKKQYDDFHKLMTEYRFSVAKDFDYSTPKTWTEKIRHGSGSLAKKVDDFLGMDTPSSRAEKKLDEMFRSLRAVRAPLLKTLEFFKENDLVLKDKDRSQEASQLKRPYRAIWVKAQRPRATRGLVRSIENGKLNYQKMDVAPNEDFISVSIGHDLNLPRKFNLS
jgi:hypothetical protein